MTFKQTFFLALAAGLLLQACGQSGALYLPGKTTPASVEPESPENPDLTKPDQQ